MSFARGSSYFHCLPVNVETIAYIYRNIPRIVTDIARMIPQTDIHVLNNPRGEIRSPSLFPFAKSSTNGKTRVGQ